MNVKIIIDNLDSLQTPLLQNPYNIWLGFQSVRLQTINFSSLYKKNYFYVRNYLYKSFK